MYRKTTMTVILITASVLAAVGTLAEEAAAVSKLPSTEVRILHVDRTIYANHDLLELYMIVHSSGGIVKQSLTDSMGNEYVALTYNQIRETATDITVDDLLAEDCPGEEHTPGYMSASFNGINTLKRCVLVPHGFTPEIMTLTDSSERLLIIPFVEPSNLCELNASVCDKGALYTVGAQQTWPPITSTVTKYDAKVTVLHLERTPYANHDLLRLNIQVEPTTRPFALTSTLRHTGGGYACCWYGYSTATSLIDSIGRQYWDGGYNQIRETATDITVDDLQAEDCPRGVEPGVNTGTAGIVTLCVLVPPGFTPEILLIEHVLGKSDSRLRQFLATPFTDPSPLCQLNAAVCDENALYTISDTQSTQRPTPRPDPEPEPEPPIPASPEYAIYYDGKVILVFDNPVIAHNPDRIGIIHDIDAYLDDESSYAGLGDADLQTVDNKRQSSVLIFELDDDTLATITESLEEYDDLIITIDNRAVFVADGFVDITTYNDNKPWLLTGTVIVR